MIHAIASRYGWSESAIFALPWVRVKEYCTEMRISDGADVVRDIPELEEDARLAEMMRDNFESIRNYNLKPKT